MAPQSEPLVPGDPMQLQVEVYGRMTHEAPPLLFRGETDHPPQIQLLTRALNRLSEVESGEYLGDVSFGDHVVLTFLYQDGARQAVDVPTSGQPWAIVRGVGSRWMSPEVRKSIDTVLWALGGPPAFGGYGDH